MRQEKNPSEFVRFPPFGTNLVSMIVEEVLPMMVVLRVSPMLFQSLV